MCLWIFDGDMINFDRITAFSTSLFKAIFSIVGYGICASNFSYSFQCMLFKHCTHIMDILKVCMWIFDGARINLTD